MSHAMIVAAERLQQPHDFFADVAAAVQADDDFVESAADAHPRTLAGAHLLIERRHQAQRRRS